MEKESTKLDAEEKREEQVMHEEQVQLSELEVALKNAEELKDLAQRVQAEFDNYRKRNTESVRNAKMDGQDSVIEMLFPVLDNFERGMNAVDEKARAGFELIYKQIMGVMEKFEVKAIEALGQEFDPNYHHAIAKCEDENNVNKVVEVFQKGYVRKNKVLRPAMVKVAQ